MRKWTILCGGRTLVFDHAQLQGCNSYILETRYSDSSVIALHSLNISCPAPSWCGRGNSEYDTVENQPFYASLWSLTFIGRVWLYFLKLDYFSRRAEVPTEQEWSLRLLVPVSGYSFRCFSQSKVVLCLISYNFCSLVYTCICRFSFLKWQRQLRRRSMLSHLILRFPCSSAREWTFVSYGSLKGGVAHLYPSDGCATSLTGKLNAK